MRKRLIGVSAIAALLVAAAGAWLAVKLHDPVFLKHQVTSRVLQATGWQLRIDGPLDVRIGTVTRIDARDVSLHHPDWPDDQPMATVAALSFSAEPFSLLGGTFVMRRLSLERCRFLFDENEQGLSNWSLATGAPTAQPDAPPSSNAVRPRWVLLAVESTDCGIRVSGVERSTVDVQVKDTRLLYVQGETVTLDAEGEIDGRPLEVHGRFGPLESLWRGGPFEHSLDSTIGENRLTSQGSAEDVVTGLGAQLSLRFQGPEFRRVTADLGWPELSEGPFDFRADLDKLADGTLIDVDGDLGAAQIHIDGELDRLFAPGRGAVSASAHGPDLGALATVLGLEDTPSRAFEFDAAARFDSAHVELEKLALRTASDLLEIEGVVAAAPSRAGTRLAVTLETGNLEEWAFLSGPVTNSPLKPRGPSSANLDLSVSDAGRIEVNGQAELHQSRLRWQGWMQDWSPSGPAAWHVDFEIEGDRLTSLGEFFGRTTLPPVPYAAEGRYAGAPDGVLLTLRDAETEGVNLELSTGFPVRDGTGPVTTKFEIRLADLAGAARLFGVESAQLPSVPIDARGTFRQEPPGWAFEGIRIDVPASDSSADAPRARLTLDSAYTTGPGAVGNHAQFRLQAQSLGMLWGGAPQGMAGEPLDVSGQWRRGKDSNALDEIKATLGPVEARFDGRLGDLSTPEAVNGHLRIQTPDATTIGRWFGRPFTDGPLGLDAVVTGGPDHVRLEELEATFAGSDARGVLALHRGTPPRLVGHLESNLVDLSGWWSVRQDGAQEEPDDGKGAADTKRILPDNPIPAMKPAALDVDLRWQADAVTGVTGAWSNVDLTFRRAESMLSLDPFSFRGPGGGTVSARFVLDGDAGEPRMEFSAAGENILTPLRAYEGQSPETIPPAEVDIDLRGHGDTVRKLAATLEGHARIYGGSGEVSMKGLKAFHSDVFDQLLQLLNPRSQPDGISRLDCSVLGARVQDGVVTVDPWVIRTADVTTLGAGTIDLRDERIDLQFNSRARKGLGVSAASLVNPFFKLGGTLASPALKIDAKRGVISGSVAVVTQGLSILAKGLVDRFFQSKDPCGEARRRIEELARSDAP